MLLVPKNCRTFHSRSKTKTNMVNYSYNIYCNRARLFHFCSDLLAWKVVFRFNATLSLKFNIFCQFLTSDCCCLLILYIFSPLYLFVVRYRAHLRCIDFPILSFSILLFSVECMRYLLLVLYLSSSSSFFDNNSQNWDNRPEISEDKMHISMSCFFLFVLCRFGFWDPLLLLLLLFSDVLCGEIYISIKPKDNAEFRWWC